MLGFSLPRCCSAVELCYRPAFGSTSVQAEASHSPSLLSGFDSPRRRTVHKEDHRPPDRPKEVLMKKLSPDRPQRNLDLH